MPPENVATHPASVFTSTSEESPEKRRRIDRASSPADYAAPAMSPPSSTDTAITVGSHNDEGRETESLSESVLEHMYEHRLRYHAYRAGKYAFPNDLVEQDRDFMKHLISNLLCDRWYLAPVDDMLARGGEVLDLGTGPGHWVLEGEHFSSIPLLCTPISLPSSSSSTVTHAPCRSGRVFSRVNVPGHRPLSHSTHRGPSKCALYGRRLRA